MEYLGRTVVVGDYDGMPFVGNVIQSRSDGGRVLRAFGNQVNIVPAESELPEVIEQLRVGDLSITHNSYPCVYGFRAEQYPHLVAGNGRFAGVVKRKLKRAGSGLRESINLALDASDPKPGDPRILAATGSYLEKDLHYLGGFDISVPYNFVKDVPVRRNKARFISSAKVLEIQEMDVSKAKEGKLAQFLFNHFLGEEPEFAIGAAVGIIEGNQFRFGIFNAPK